MFNSPHIRLRNHSLLLAGMVLAFSANGMDYAKLADPSARGYPRITFTAGGTYQIFRRADGDYSYCPSGDITKDNAGGVWCRNKIHISPSTLTWQDTSGVMPSAIDASSPLEFEYKVGHSVDINDAQYLGWARRCEIGNADPIDKWLKKINTIAKFPLITRSDIPAAHDPTEFVVLKKTKPDGVAVAVTLLYNNKYLALFNMNGGIISFTHRSYGSDFLNLSPNDSLDAVQPWILYTKSNTDESAAQQAYVADAKTMKISSPTLTNGALVFKYTESRYPELQATALAVEWRLQSRDEVGKNAGLRGRLIVDGAPPSGREFQRAEFPVLRGLAYDKGTQVMVPQHSGGRMYSGWGEGATPTSYGSGLLTSAWSLPLVVVKKGNYSLMWAAEDSNNFPKAFAIEDFWKEGGTGPIHANDGRFHHYRVGGLDKGPNYDVVLTPMCGDWIRPTKKYRNWATTQAWTKSGTAALIVANRNAVSPTLRNGLFWWLTFLDPNDANAPTSFQSYAKNLKSNIGPAQNVNVGFHLYQWYKNRFDVLLPEFDPKHSVGQDPVTQWRTAIGDAQKDGSIVTPYISATLIDISDATSSEVTNRPVSPAACNLVGDGWWTRDYQGVALRDFVMKRGPTSVFTGCFNSGKLLAFMDPSSTAWQQINQSNVNKVFELDSGGIYLDSFPAVFRRDYSGRHSDSAGSWWLDGTLAIAAQTVATASDHEAIRPVSGASRRMTSSEFFMEPAMPFIDVVMNYGAPKPTDLPLVQAVYSDYQMIAGQVVRQDQSDTARAAILGRSFVWGYQLGLFGPTGLCKKETCVDTSGNPLPGVTAYARQLAQARLKLNALLSYGKFLGTADDVSAATSNWKNYDGVDNWCSNDNNSCPGTLPFVRGAVWGADTLTPATWKVILTNVDSSDKTALIPLPKSWLNSASRVSVKSCSADGVVCDGVGKSFTDGYEVTVPAFGVRVLHKVD